MLIFTVAFIVLILVLVRIFRTGKTNSQPYDSKSKYDYRGFDENHIHKNGTKYDDYGYDYYGFDKNGYDRQGFNINGKNNKGKYNRKHDRKNYINREKYNDDGFYDYRKFPIGITDHARERIRERMGITESKRVNDLVNEAYCYGKSARQIKKTSAMLVREIESREDNSIVLIYRSHIYIFTQDNTLKTVYRNDKISL